MEAVKEFILKADLIHGKENIGSVEKELYLLEGNGTPEEEGQTKALDEIVNDIIDSIDKECKEKKVKVADKTKLCFNIILALVVPVKEEDTVTIEVPVVNEEENKGEGKNE